MIIFRTIDENLHIGEPLAIALGTFDGIHIGHRHILEDAVSEARARNMSSACYCFSNIPKEFLSIRSGISACSMRRLCSEEEKMELLSEIGLDYVFSVPFDEVTMSVKAEEFVIGTLIHKLNAGLICCGFNYTFGRGAEGTTNMLSAIASQYGVDVNVHAPVYVDGHLVSSTAIRGLLESGGEQLAHKMLGR